MPPLLWAGVIVFATSIPTNRVPHQLTPFDKVIHFLMYFGLSVLLTRWVLAGRSGLRAVVISAAAAVAFGAADEWHQEFIPGRSSELADWIADSAGAVVGAALAFAVARRRPKVASSS